MTYNQMVEDNGKDNNDTSISNQKQINYRAASVVEH